MLNMLNIQTLGWDPETLGEIDHQKVKAPYLRLSSYTIGTKGDVVYVYDLRMTQPSKTYMETDVLHSLEHLLLAGFRKHMADHFINIAPMGCQTGFYLILMNEGNADKVCLCFKQILEEIAILDKVPYVDLENCGQPTHHSLKKAQDFAKSLLDQQTAWRQVF